MASRLSATGPPLGPTEPAVTPVFARYWLHEPAPLGGLAANVRQTMDVFVDDPGAFANNQRVIAVLPFFHIYGFTCVMLFGVVLGLNQLLLPRFDVEEVLDLFEEERPAMFSGVTTSPLRAARTRRPRRRRR